MTIGEATGLLGLLRSLLLDRPSVDIILTAVDHGDPPPGFITPRIGKLVYIEVHATGRTPVRVTWVGLECQDGELVPFGSGVSLPSGIHRPDTVTRYTSLAALATALNRRNGSRGSYRRILVKASPRHTFRRRLPKGWSGFPLEDPPFVSRG